MPPGRLHPAECPRPAHSEAEKAVWSALKDGLPSGWSAWHSLRVRDGKGYLGEGDFVLAHARRGLLVLEVKGGRIEQRDGRWFTNGVPLERPPLDQALGFARKLVRRLADWGCEPPAFGAAVAFPDIDFDEGPQEDDLRGVVLGHSHLRWLAQALPKVVERALPPAQDARGGWMERLHQLWGETWVPALSLGSRVRALDDRRLALDAGQLAVLEGLLENEQVLVQGGAGSGKTLLAAEAARRHAAEGKRVLLLCFTAPLRHWLESRVAGSGVEVNTVSGLARALVEAADGAARATELTASEHWKRLFERAVDVAEPRWDAIVLDEAQDLTFEAWFLVRELARGVRLWAFHDPGQAYWSDRTVPHELFAARFRLARGQRCPPGVAALASLYLAEAGDERAIEEARTSGQLRLVACAEPSRAADAVAYEIDRLLSQGLSAGDIGVVSLRGKAVEGAVHHGDRIGRHPFVHADHAEMEDRLVADTFLRWKGLERPAIVVADVPADAALERFGTRMHIALTRALVTARIVAPGRDGRWPGLPARAAP